MLTGTGRFGNPSGTIVLDGALLASSPPMTATASGSVTFTEPASNHVCDHHHDGHDSSRGSHGRGHDDERRHDWHRVVGQRFSVTEIRSAAQALWAEVEAGEVCESRKVAAKLGAERTDFFEQESEVGVVVHHRRDHLVHGDGGLHFEGTGETAWGVKFVLVAARSADPHGRIILDIEWVPTPGGEARTAMDCFTRLAPSVEGAQGVVYDTALRGVHHQAVLQDLGLIPINRVTAAKAAAKTPRRKGGRRSPKSTYLEDKTIDDAVRQRDHLPLRTDGALGIGELTDTGEMHFVPLRRVRTHRNPGRKGTFRWYNDYRLPESYGGGTITVRLHGTPADADRKLNRTENLRPIPPDDPDFKRLYPRRNDAESINRGLDDSLWLGRAHSLGHARQHVDLLGYALMVNGIALHRHAKRRPALAA